MVEDRGVIDATHLDLQDAPIRHGIARVHGEVDQNLLELARVRTHDRRQAIEPGDEADLLADEAA